jgi:hypothetical protein
MFNFCGKPKLACGLVIVGAVMASLSPVSAETWVCDLKVGKRQHVLPNKVTFKFDEYIQDVIVTDSYSQRFGVNIIRGEVRADNDKSRRISWEVSGIPIQNKNSEFAWFTGVAFKAAMMNKDKKIILTAIPKIRASQHAISQRGVGKCAIKK